jgi:hypothetical protein
MDDWKTRCEENIFVYLSRLNTQMRDVSRIIEDYIFCPDCIDLSTECFQMTYNKLWPEQPCIICGGMVCSTCKWTCENCFRSAHTTCILFRERPTVLQCTGRPCLKTTRWCHSRECLRIGKGKIEMCEHLNVFYHCNRHNAVCACETRQTKTLLSDEEPEEPEVVQTADIDLDDVDNLDDLKDLKTVFSQRKRKRLRKFEEVESEEGEPQSCDDEEMPDEANEDASEDANDDANEDAFEEDGQEEEEEEEEEEAASKQGEETTDSE